MLWIKRSYIVTTWIPNNPSTFAEQPVHPRDSKSSHGKALQQGRPLFRWPKAGRRAGERYNHHCRHHYFRYCYHHPIIITTDQKQEGELVITITKISTSVPDRTYLEQVTVKAVPIGHVSNTWDKVWPSAEKQMAVSNSQSGALWSPGHSSCILSEMNTSGGCWFCSSAGTILAF